MYVLGLDLETTGLDTQNDRIIEIGAVLWDTQHDKPVAMLNQLVNIGQQKLLDIITELTGISDNDLNQFGITEVAALKALLELADKAIYIVAHNGNQFDKPVLENALKKHQLSLNKPWIDTQTDIPYPSTIKTRKLTYLAAEHKIINPYSHRALFDVLTMLQVASHYDWSKIIKNAATPTLRVIAKVDYDSRDKAKQAGFRWDKSKSQWVKEMKKDQYEQANFAFDCSTTLV